MRSNSLWLLTMVAACCLSLCVLSSPSPLMAQEDGAGETKDDEGQASDDGGSEDGDAQQDDAKADDAKADDAKADDAKADDAKADDAKADDAKADDAKADDAKADDTTADDTKAEPSGGSTSGRTEEFNTAFAEWKADITTLRRLQLEYTNAAEGDSEKIREEWNKTLDHARSLIETLATSGKSSYEAAPNQDRELSSFLGTLAQDYLAHDEIEKAHDLAATLAENDSDDLTVLNVAGITSFILNDYENAETYLKKAEEQGVISQRAQDYLGLLPDYKKFWAEEKKLRDAEEAAEGEEQLPRVKMETSKGTLVLELFENEAPETVANFVSLVEKGFYDGVSFHRVLPGFVAQGGDPQGDGSGGPGYTIYCECKKPNHRKHFRGVLSMAHRGPDTGGSQFFITFAPTAHLNGLHTVFGRVVEGTEVLAKIQRINPARKTSLEPDTIVKAEMIRKRKHEYVPNKVGNE